MELRRVDDVRHEIERDRGRGMNTGVRVYATDSMLEKMKQDRTLQQAVNATALPGIVGSVMVMPDGHEGYGFPVGGVVAFDAENGIISPGAIGFDINCLYPETKIYDEWGAWKKICDVNLNDNKILAFDRKSERKILVTPVLYEWREETDSLLRLKTAYGKEIHVTKDHPMLTQRGMVRAEELTTDDSLVSNGFEGFECSKPTQKLILTELDLERTMNRLGISESGNGRKQVLTHLQKLGLKSLETIDKRLAPLLKILGFVFGDGTIPATKGSKYVSFYGKEEDLKELEKDIEVLGFKGHMFKRARHHRITTVYGTSEFDFEECSLTVGSNSFAVLLVALGAPFGNKAKVSYRVPVWIMELEKWQKRLFVAAYFGAELTKPITHNGYNFIAPAFSVNKLRSLAENALQFLQDFRDMLSSFGVNTSAPSIVEGYRYDGASGETVGFRLQVLSNTQNLINFFGGVGYLYNRGKERLASLTSLYLRYVEGVRADRVEIRKRAIEMYAGGTSAEIIVSALENKNAGRGFIEHAIWNERRGARLWQHLKFQGFIDIYEIGESGYVYDRIEKIEKRGYNGKVYDITIDNENHNFVANGIVVSNCGVRLVKTNLTEQEVKSRLNPLMDRLFANIPSGVGSRLKLGFTGADLQKVSEEGVEHVVKKGFGFADDIERIEENGSIEGADFSKVSSMAKSRGNDQLGTLGAGNHFLEVQKIDRIYNEQVAKHYGLFEGQVVVMVHTGSRGFGHQVCSDYLRTLVEYQHKNNIKLPDPELSYAVVGDREADDYLGAMKCAVNYAFTNRQLITHAIRKSFEEVFEKSADAMGMEILYDVAHNIAKPEEHMFEGKKVKVYVHRKGATRAFPKGRDEIPKIYRNVGQPVIIPGSMGTASFVLCGDEGSMKETFGSTCHGSGRLMSRHQALREIPASRTFGDLEKKKIVVRIRTRKLISEEAEWAYKNVDDVVGVVEKAGISIIVSRNVPLGVAKG